MKTAFFTQNVNQGGLDTFILNLIKYWPEDDQITLFCNRSHPGLPMLCKHLAGKVTVVPYDFWIAQDIGDRLARAPVIARLLFRALFWLFGFPYLLFQTRAVLKKNNPDRLMVINGGYPGGDACLAATIVWASINPKAPAWHNFHNLVVPHSNWPLRKLKEQLIDYFLVRAAAGFVTVSGACMKTLDIRPKLAASNRAFIYNGTVPMVPRFKTSLALELGLPRDTPVILMLAVYQPRKGHAFMIRAFEKVVRQVPSAALVMCGDGSSDEVERVRQMRNTSASAQQIFLQGHRTDVDDLLSQAAVLVLPSQAQESFGYSAVEGMASSCPVVVTDIGGLPEVVENGVSGFVVPSDDCSAFADRIVALLQDGALRSRIGKAGKARYKDLFQAKRMSNEYWQLLEGTVRLRNRHGSSA